MNFLKYKYPCPTCGELKSIKLSKKEKPYYFCDYCGVQVFIRGKEGERRLEEIVQTRLLDEFKEKGTLGDKLALIGLEANMCFLERAIERFEGKSKSSRREKFALNDLRKKLKALEADYFQKLKDL